MDLGHAAAQDGSRSWSSPVWLAVDGRQGGRQGQLKSYNVLRCMLTAAAAAAAQIDARIDMAEPDQQLLHECM